MPWYIQYCPPPESAKSEGKTSSRDVGELEALTSEAEELSSRLASRISELESIASGRPPKSSQKAEQKSKLQFHWDISSPSCQGPALFLQKTGLKYEETVHAQDEKAVHSNRNHPENCKFNFNHAVPTLVDDGFGVFESHSILRYLAEKYFPNSDWYPDNLETRTRINMYLDWQAYTIHSAFINLGVALLPGQQEQKLDPSKAYMTLAKEIIFGSQHHLWQGRADNGLVAHLTVVNDKWLGGKLPFIAGSKPSIADLALYAHSGYILHMIGLEFTKYPNIKSWYERMDKEFGSLGARKQYIAIMVTYGEAFEDVFAQLRK